MLDADKGTTEHPAGTCDPQRRAGVLGPRLRGIAPLCFQDCGLLDWAYIWPARLGIHLPGR